jgi:hypothetical protein
VRVRDGEKKSADGERLRVSRMSGSYHYHSKIDYY